MEDKKYITLGILGDGETGKTQIYNVFLGQEFQFDGYIKLGNDKSIKTIKLKNNEDIKLSLWDTLGNERFQDASLQTVRNVEGVILVYDILNRLSFDHLNKWLDNIKERLKEPEIILFGNKADYDEYERKITSEEVKKYAEEKEIAFFEVSARTGKGINEGFLYIANKIYDKKYGHNKTNNEIIINNKDISNEKNKSDCVGNKKNNNSKKK